MRARNFFDLLLYKVGANLRTEVARYYLNNLWWVINPILQMGVYYLVFGIMLNRGTENYASFLMIGVITWGWFSQSVNNGSNSIMANAGLISQVHITKVFFPLEVCCQDSFKELIATGVLLVFLFFAPPPVTITWIMLPVIMLIQFIFIVAVTTLCAAIVPFVPDLRFIIGTGLMLAMFISGVFYDINTNLLPQHKQLLVLFDPMAGLIAEYRNILMYAKWPDFGYLAYVLVFSLVLLAASFFVVFKFDHIYPRITQQ